MLSKTDFKQLIKNAPLFAVDLVVLNEKNQILVGQRQNAPAQGFWFVPGGRVYKNESLPSAFNRISQAELGLTLNIENAQLLGLYDHFYKDSAFGEGISTHYINATHLVHLSSEQLTNLPKEQHQDYRWAAINELESDQTVHFFSKIFLPALKAAIKE